jgi:DNA-binding response OmpR family regulator
MDREVKILFVDDEPAIRLSLPAVLQLHGFEVVAVANVSEALQAIASSKFDVLISDLNIGSPGDGFTVVSAMRRTQPDCVTLILTGYPAFESALQAIRSQVDDYLIKPAGTDKLVAAIEEHLRYRQPHHLVPLKRLAELLRSNAAKIAEDVVYSEKHIMQLPRIHLTEEECRENAKAFVLALANQLEQGKGDLSPEVVQLSRDHGRARYEQGYSEPLLVDESRIFCSAILDCVQANLLAADVSNLVPDLKSATNILASILREAMTAFSSVSRVA